MLSFLGKGDAPGLLYLDVPAVYTVLGRVSQWRLLPGVGLGEVTKGAAVQIKPTQESLNLLKAFKGGSELVLIFHAEIRLRNQAEKWMRSSARGEQLTSRRGFRLWGCPLKLSTSLYSGAGYVWTLCYV